jgi:hypothetical protein
MTNGGASGESQLAEVVNGQIQLLFTWIFQLGLSLSCGIKQGIL